MYQIGIFSKINRITTKTLRHYDEMDLLKPAYIDEFTGYRYYTSEQLPRLHRIISLKQMGFSLPEIKQILSSDTLAQEKLRAKQDEVAALLRKQQQMLRQIENYMKRNEGGIVMNYTPVIKALPEVIVASMRTTVPGYDTYFDIVPKMGDQMRADGAVCAQPEYCFTIYHDGEYKDSDIDVEVCEAVTDFCEDSDMVKYKRIGKVDQALCVLHKGPYSTIRSAYAFAFEWIRDNAYEPVGSPRESYIDGIWNKDTEEDWLTELQIPINKQ